jgi:outer membrane protein assembly factor BamB
VKARILAAFILATAVSGANAGPATATTNAEWSQYRYSATHDGFNPSETVLNSGNVSRLVPLWQASPGTADDEPVVADGRIFAADWTGGLHALRARDGAPLWTADLGRPSAWSTPLVSGELVVMADRGWPSSAVSAFDERTGTLRWRTQLGLSLDYTLSFPVAYGSSILVAAGGAVFSLSARTGSIAWSTLLTSDAANSVTGRVAISADGRLAIATTRDGRVFGLSRSTGRVVWTTDVGGNLGSGGFAGASISNGVAYVASNIDDAGAIHSRLYALRVASGRVIWSRDCGNWVWATPTVGRGLVYVDAVDTTLRAFNVRTGSGRWVVSVPGLGYWSPSPVLANGVLYASTGASFVALNARTGTLLFTFTNPYDSQDHLSSPTVTGGRVYVSSHAGHFWVFGLAQV